LIAGAAYSEQPEQPRHREPEPPDARFPAQTPGSIVIRVSFIASAYPCQGDGKVPKQPGEFPRTPQITVTVY
jgi:hypothetical protein